MSNFDSELKGLVQEMIDAQHEILSLLDDEKDILESILEDIKGLKG